MRNFCTSDHHFGQESFHRYSDKYQDTMRPSAANAEEWAMDYIVRHNSIVPEWDSTVYFIGDIARNITWAEKVLPKLNGQHKYLVMGNHDSKYPTFRLQNLFDKLLGVIYLNNKKYILTHVPVHPTELRGMINVHGHTHKNVIPDSRYINVCVDNLESPLELI